MSWTWIFMYLDLGVVSRTMGCFSLLGRCPPTSASARWEENSNLNTEVLQGTPSVHSQAGRTAGRFDVLCVPKHFHLYKMEYFWYENLFEYFDGRAVPQINSNLLPVFIRRLSRLLPSIILWLRVALLSRDSSNMLSGGGGKTPAVTDVPPQAK